MKILVAGMWPSKDAPERGIFVSRQVDALRSLGHEVTVAPLTDIRTGALRTPLKYLSLTWRTCRAARQVRPDIVVGHYLVPTGSAVRIASRLARIPYCVVAHGTDVRMAETLGRTRVRTRTVVRGAVAAICVSEDLAKRLGFLFPDISIDVCDMGVDTDLMRPGFDTRAPLDPDDPDQPIVVAVGSLVANKNHARLIEAFSHLGRGRLTIIGAGPLEHDLRSLGDRLGLGDRLTLAGRVAHENLGDLYRSAHVATLISIDEGFGLSGLEALACGTPLVVSRTAPVTECIIDGATGVIVNPVDIADIERGLRTASQLTLTDGDAEAAVAGRSTVDRARLFADVLERATSLHQG